MANKKMALGTLEKTMKKKTIAMEFWKKTRNKNSIPLGALEKSRKKKTMALRI
jgi:hypothetical protein